ncbi:cell division protein PerM [Nocardioides jiangxiensis]|uniref:DUF6350 family protein n=1 Tax=Nocardioides jiangxiensis TaxID=3064524 RepID=A0ABT9AZV8_9ACTN|nr:DUF6350 family protein [Nocardioides sp. WY-20]MDO7867569.1 DUF6350 family protein [Nocardioides sp. WY-20]
MSSRIRFSAYHPSPPESGGEQQRSLALLAVRGGVLAAALPLSALMAVALVGWFLTDGGAHGAPRDALRVGALAWLMAHGSSIHVQGAAITALPLGLTALVGYAVARAGLRTGERLSSHGPDAYALSDGERDLTVPAGVAIFTASYVVVGIVVAVVAGSLSTRPSLPAVLLWCIVLAAGVGGTGIAVGSGRAAVWLGAVPESVRETLVGALRILGWYLVLATVVFLAALLLDGAAALNVLSQLGTNLGGGVVYVTLSLLVVPNAVACAGAYLLGPGFTVGTGTLVSPTVVALGPVPMFPLLAALPDNGPTPFWTPFLIALPPILAAAVVVGGRHRRPTTDWDIGAVRGLSAGVLAAVLFAILAALAGGAVGPGRMTDVGPLVASSFFHAIVSFGIGGLVGGLLATWLTRRNPPPVVVVPGPVDQDREETVVVRSSSGSSDDEPTVVVTGAAAADGAGAADAEATVPLLGRLLRRRGSDETVAGEDTDRG